MEEQVVSFETAKIAKEKGFKELCFHYYSNEGLQTPYLENGSSTDVDFRVDLEDLLEQHNNLYHNTASAPTQTLLQRWLREEHDIHIHIIREDSYYKFENKYYSFYINIGKDKDVTNSENLFWDLMNECSQDIPGNYLNNEKFYKIIFKRKYAFDIYEKALEEALGRALELIK